ncbi:MAG: YidH family protein [Anderseniella sp.]
MSNQSTVTPTATELAEQRTDLAGDRTRWAADRTLWAADRTFIAWLRTAISMIGFGISIGKAGDALRQNEIMTDEYYSLQITGVIFIVLAIAGLTGALVQDFRIQRRLSDQGFGRVEPVPLGLAMGILVLGFGVIGGVFIFL